MLNKQAYAKIHILLKEHNIDDETYRTILWGNFGVGSSKDLNYKQYIQLLRILQKSFKKHFKTEKQTGNKITDKQKSYINDLMKNNGNIFNAEKYISKVIHREIKSIDELTKREAGIVISILRRINA